MFDFINAMRELVQAQVAAQMLRIKEDREADARNREENARIREDNEKADVRIQRQHEEFVAATNANTAAILKLAEAIGKAFER
jgi:hypothetical protein